MMYCIGDIVFRTGEEDTPLLVLEVAGDFLRVVRFCADGGEGVERLNDNDVVDAADLASSLTGIDTWDGSRIPRAEAKKLVENAHLSSACMDRILRRMGRQVARTHTFAVHAPKPFVPGESPIPVSGKCWEAEEAENLCEASLDFWLTSGRFGEAFEKRFAKTVGRKHAFAVNSGSSANLLAMASLCSPLLGERRLQPGDEVITVAAGFPTTVAPIVQMGLVPVFVDVELPTYNAVAQQVAEAVTSRTKAIILAHTLGNPFNLTAIKNLADEHGLWFVEDSCDALGSTFDLNGESKLCGTFGHLGTFSFYPAHHITMGEGGAVVCDDPLLRKIVLSLRDWGRDCWCPPGKDNTCSRRYQWKFPLLPKGYDHKYVYSHLGYNLKITDMQAAVGLAQLDRLEGFTAKRRQNFAQLHEALSPLDGGKLILPQPTPDSTPSWFGFPITLAQGLDRQGLLESLNERRIGTRLLFAGNMTKQPCFEGVSYQAPFGLACTDIIMEHTFWVGVYPGLGEAHLQYIVESITDWLSRC